MGYDELYEILTWMPAKSAIKLSSSLCKSFHNIPSEPNFAKRQCIRSQLDTAFFMQKSSCNIHSNPTTVDQLHSKPTEFLTLPSSASSGIPRESLNTIRHCGRICSSSNGLLLLARKDEVDHPCSSNVKFWVCNPATGMLALLDPPNAFNYLLEDGTFGFSPLIECYPRRSGNTTSSSLFPNDYTVALLVATTSTRWEDRDKDRNYQLLIYSNGMWEEDLCDLTLEGWRLRLNEPVSVFSDATKGIVVHYLCERNEFGRPDPNILAFDLKKKKLSKKIKLPEGASDPDLDHGLGCSSGKVWIFKWGEKSICLVRWFMREFKVWLLDGCDDSSGSWRRVMNMTEEEILGFDVEVESFGVANGGLLLATKTRVYVYMMEGENRGRLEVVGEHDFCGSVVPIHMKRVNSIKFLPYANTLRPVCV